ncbi:hypothetical protein LCGC14_0709680 [marine sediment metagenome]|uniref:Beta-phosphoglucomutase n=1 Tax=marine sediment metagenome TaxID=412755 RepID=A0A0F9QFH4_9ZZZZ
MFSNYCVIFDMDGVLIDSGSLHFESWVKIAKEMGVKFSKKFFEQVFGQQSTTIIRKLVGSKVDQILVEQWAILKENHYREIARNKLEPLPGVIRILSELKRIGFKLAVGSSGPPENVALTLNTLNITKYFDTIITAAEVEKGKPEPDVFLIAAKNLKIKPKNCLVIEDAPVGIEAAKRAGMLSVALTTTHSKKELFGARLIIRDLSVITITEIIKLFNIN